MKKNKAETLSFIKNIIIDLKRNYEYEETVIDKLLTSINYLEQANETKHK